MRGICSEKRKKYANGGLITGPGTGTSDDIDMQARKGSYIMPADSTAQVGANNLAQMGTAPVSVSNGEFQLPPEQVHAIGVQTLDNLKGQTHEMIGGPGQEAKPRHFFADGGVVDDPRRRIYVDAQGRAMNALPSQGTGMATTPQAPQSAQPPIVERSPPAPRFNATPSGPAITTGSPGPGLGAFGPREGRSSPPNRDWQARAEGLARAKADTAAYETARAAQDKKFANAGSAPPKAPASPAPTSGGFGAKAKGILDKAGNSKLVRGAGPTGAVLSGLPEASDVATVANDPGSTGIDTATQAAEGTARLAGTGAGAGFGAKLGAGLGTLGGPLSWATIPLGALAGGAIGGYVGNELTDSAIRSGRELVGVDPSSPVDRVQPAPQEEMPYGDFYEPESEPQAPMQNDIRREGNSFSGTNIGPGYTINGRPSAEADPLVYHDENPSLAGAQNQLAKQRLFANTPEYTPGAGSGNYSGSGQPATGGLQLGAPRPGGGGGGTARLIRSSGTPSNGEILRERMRGQRDQIAQRGQQISADTNLRQQAIDMQGRTLDANLERDRAERAVAARAAARMEALRERYDQAESVEEKQAIALAIRDMLGQARPAYQIARTDRLVNPDDPMSQKLSESYIIDPATGQARPVSGGSASARIPPQNHVAALLQNPALAAQFDETYGPGSAARYGVR